MLIVFSINHSLYPPFMESSFYHSIAEALSCGEHRDLCGAANRNPRQRISTPTMWPGGGKSGAKYGDFRVFICFFLWKFMVMYGEKHGRKTMKWNKWICGW
jgi:hypothetical protein